MNACVRASDAICVARLGEHALGDDHLEATQLLATVPDGSTLAAKLKVAIQYKSQWSYGVTEIRKQDLTRVLRAAETLVAAAEVSA